MVSKSKSMFLYQAALLLGAATHLYVFSKSINIASVFESAHCLLKGAHSWEEQFVCCQDVSWLFYLQKSLCRPSLPPRV